MKFYDIDNFRYFLDGTLISDDSSPMLISFDVSIYL